MHFVLFLINSNILMYFSVVTWGSEPLYLWKLI
uniref:Uncharacterized protein n=1 Tax=Anguilla anguilla TaxID=7936 RepID=A0A0E9U640_ANGAN